MELNIKEEKLYHHNSERLMKEHKRLDISGVHFFFDAIQINEVVIQEDFEVLFNALGKIYNSTERSKHEFQNRNIEKWLNDSNKLGKQFLPMLTSKDFTGVLKKNLPNSIDAIRIDLEKASSEFVLLNISFFIEAETMKRFQSLIDYIDKPEIISEFLNEKEGNMVRIIDAIRVKEKKLDEFILSVKKEAVIYMARFISFGEFYKKDSDDYFKNFPSMNIFSFTGNKDILLGNKDFLQVIGLNFIDYHTLEGEYFLSIKTEERNTMTLLINGDKGGKYKWHILKESFFSYFSMLQYFIMLDKQIQDTISRIIGKKTLESDKNKLQKKMILLMHIFNRMKGSVERMHFESIGLVRKKVCECCKNDFSKIYEDYIKKFTKRQSKLIVQSITSIEGLVNLESIDQNKKLGDRMYVLTFTMVIMMIIQLALLEYDEKSLFEHLLKIIFF